MVFRFFVIALILRLVLVGVAMAVVMWLLLEPGYHSATLLSAIVLALLVAELWRYVSRTNREVARFLDAVRFADYSQRFDFEKAGSGFASLGRTFTAIIEEMRERRTDQESDMRHLKALVEHIPVPLMTVHADDAITLQNNAARRLFGSTHVTRVNDLTQFGPGFARAVDEAIPGDRELVAFTVEGAEYRLTLAATEIIIGGNRERLISLQDIQSEIDATQAEAWQDLVRVLTHEIMNSITPVTSLAQTAVELVDDVVRETGPESPIAEELEDVQSAVATVARRSDSLMQFIDGYRQITRLAPPEKKRIALVDLFETVTSLARAEWNDPDVALSSAVKPSGLYVYADRDLLEPVLLNLLRNAWQATKGMEAPSIELRGRLNRRGNTVIEVEDNGHGVPDEIATKIFVPFFTTREGGSGVGLALARQVMIAHGGFIRLGQNSAAGTLFTLTF
ncbi:MAG: PAS domain-containing protein [Gammaproteobacteria bacterium]|jgi:nitrogen fixation/metabolism regulation signal transduction histidine kinase|nr:PAS domain-containing protein [Gammaproteobacteria bacterium]